jgi:hypothetical protein
MITLYCDESDDGYTYALAGWVADPDAWDRIDGAWRVMLYRHRLPTGEPMTAFHAVDIVERENVRGSKFKGWTFDQERAVFSDACDILLNRDYAPKLWRLGVSIAFSRRWIQDTNVTARQRDEWAWLLLFRRLFQLTVARFHDRTGIAFIFDEKETIRERVNAFFYKAKSDFESTVSFRQACVRPDGHRSSRRVIAG